MKKIVLYFWLMGAVFLCIACSADTEKEQETVSDGEESKVSAAAYKEWINEDTGAYQYPVVPGTPEWESLASGEEMVHACEIPEEILENISTEELLELLLQYPLLDSFLLSSENEAAGFEEMVEQFNGIQEFMSRKDMYNIIKTVYTDYNLESGDNSYQKIEAMEMIFLNPESVKTFSEEEKDEIAEMVYQKYIEKGKSDSYAGTADSAYRYAVLYGTEDTLSHYNEEAESLCKQVES